MTGDAPVPVAPVPVAPAAVSAAAPIDLVLGDAVAGGPELGPAHTAALADLRARLQVDALLAIEVAETRDLIERCRALTVAASPVFAARLYDVVLRAELRAPRSPVRLAPWQPWLAVAAALLTVALLVWLDPLQVHRRGNQVVAWAVAPADREPLPAAAAPVVAEQQELTTAMVWFESVVARMRQRLAAEGAAALQRELEAGLAPPSDPLQTWLDPQHAMVELRLAHELRPRLELRHAALRAAGSLPVVDDRVQALAAGIAAELQADREPARRRDLASEALAVRALLAAGLTSEARAAAVDAAIERLVEALPALTGVDLLATLPAVAEYAAVCGVGAGRVVAAGQRLLDEVLRPDEDAWSRRLPALLGRKVPTALLGDGGRLARLLPAFGLPVDRCQLLRRLWLGQLRERMLLDQGPEPAVAALYGFADLLAPDEVDLLALELQRWQPARLVPDYATVQQLVWGMAPGLPGHTRVHAGLRRLAAAADPAALPARARLCLALACHYAARPLQAAALRLGL